MKIDCQLSNELIHISTESNEGSISVSIALTSLTIQEDNNNNDQTSDEFLSKTSCCNALNAMQSVRWFQLRQVGKRPYASPLIRCLRYQIQTKLHCQAFSSEV